MKRRNQTLLGGFVFLVIASGCFGVARADEGPPPPEPPRTEALDDYTLHVAEMLPGFSPSMLDAPEGARWLAGKTIHDVSQSVFDIDPREMASQGSMLIGWDPPDGPRYVKLDFDRGFVRYSNRERAFQEGSPCVAIPESAARGMFLESMNALGLPTEEWGPLDVALVMERSVEGDGGLRQEETCEVERLVTMERRSGNGFPIFDCWARGAISNLSTCSRMSVQWPRFVLAPGLMMRSRGEVISDLGRRIWEAESDDSGLGPRVDLNVQIGYVRTTAGFAPVAMAGWSDTSGVNAGELEYVSLAINPNSDVAPYEGGSRIEFRAFFDGYDQLAVIEFYLPVAQRVRLSIFDASGREIRTVTDERVSEGWHRLRWNLTDDEGRRVPSGVYFAKLQAEAGASARKFIVIK